MTDPSKIKPSHLQREAYVYIRQSTPGQVEHNRESTARQYALADKARQLGWPKQQVVIVDEDLGLSGSGADKRSGFARLTSEVALAHVGIVLGLEVSRLARNNADWYRLLELCGVTPAAIEATRMSGRATEIEPRCDVVSMAFGSGTYTLRSGTGRAPLSHCGSGKPARRTRSGSRMETRLRAVADAETELRRREQQRPASLETAQLEALLRLGCDLGKVWNAPTTTDRDRKQLLLSLLEEVILNLKRAEGRAHLTPAMAWRRDH